MLLILIGSQPRLVLPVMQAAAALGNSRCIVLGNEESRHLRWSSLCERIDVVDFQNILETELQLQRLAREFADAVLVPCDCPAIRLLQALRDRVPLLTTPIPDAGTLEQLDDKWLFYELCVAQGFPVPATLHRASKRELHFDELARTLGVPFIVKPSNCSGSLGVVVIRSKAGLERDILSNPQYVTGPLVVQKYIDGWDIDVDLVAVAGTLTAVTTHRVSGCWMEFTRNAALEDLAAALCRCTNYSGPMNIDARIDRATGRPFLIESNPRFWASLAAPLACGLNFLEESLRAAGVAPIEPRRPTSARCNRRHPLLRPSEWWMLFSDPGPQGQVLRMAMFDPYTLGEFAAGLPTMAGRAMQRIRHGLARGLPEKQSL